MIAMPREGKKVESALTCIVFEATFVMRDSHVRKVALLQSTYALDVNPRAGTYPRKKC